MAFIMKYNKGGFPFKNSPLKVADANLVNAARSVALSGTEAENFGEEGTLGKAMVKGVGSFAKSYTKEKLKKKNDQKDEEKDDEKDGDE